MIVNELCVTFYTGTIILSCIWCVDNLKYINYASNIYSKWQGKIYLIWFFKSKYLKTLRLYL